MIYFVRIRIYRGRNAFITILIVSLSTTSPFLQPFGSASRTPRGDPASSYSEESNGRFYQEKVALSHRHHRRGSEWGEEIRHTPP